MMKKRVVAVITVFTLMLSLISGMILPLQAEGEIPFARDLETNPDARTFYVENQADLEALAEAVNGGNRMKGYTFLQTADITLEGQWTPIGNNPNNYQPSSADFNNAFPFMGTYDGQKHTISNLQIDLNQNGVGLFGCCLNATLKNIGIESGSVKGVNRAGGIAGYADCSKIYNCYNKADITLKSGADGVGGIAGVARPAMNNVAAEVYGCFNLGTISAPNMAAAGIIGWTCRSDAANYFHISGCYSGGKIRFTKEQGGDPRCDPIARNWGRTLGDFSNSYYLSGICNDKYNYNNATKLAAEDNIRMAYVLNHATGENSNTFTVDESGELVFYHGEGNAIGQLTVQYIRDGVLLGEEKSYQAAGGKFILPQTYQGYSVRTAYLGDRRYFAGSAVPITGEDQLLEVTLVGEWPSVEEIATQPDAEYYTVSSAKELQAMDALVEAGYDYAGKTVLVTEDLDFSGYTTWSPIGHITESPSGNPDAAATAFKGTFDGQYHHFKNINFTQTGNYQSIFLYIEEGTIQNIILDEGKITTNGARGAALVAMLRNSTMKNIENHVDVYAVNCFAETTGVPQQNWNFGVVALSPDSTIESVVNYGDMGNGSKNSQEQQNGSISGYGYQNHGGHTCTIYSSIAVGAVYGTGSDPVARGASLKNCLAQPEQEVLMQQETAWNLNTVHGSKANSGAWTIGEYGPVLNPEKGTLRQLYNLVDEKGNALGEMVAYCQTGDAIEFPPIPGYCIKTALLNGKTMEEGLIATRDLNINLALSNETYDITYVTNGGSFAEEPVRSYTTGTAEMLPDAGNISKSGYGFAGWYTDAEFTGQRVTTIEEDQYGDVTYYAKWVVPFEIDTPEKLAAVAAGDLDGCYTMTADIDMTGVAFTAIGTREAPFTGVFDGNGYIISGLEIEVAENYQGLFGVNAGTVRNVTLAEDCTIAGNAYVGGIAGKNEGLIENCISRATVNVKKNESIASYKLFNQNLCQWGDDEFAGTNLSRRPGMLARIEAYDPDLMTFQELSFNKNTAGVASWKSFLDANITDTYTMYAKDRGDGEGVAVAYKTEKFELIDAGYFWISDTPDAAKNHIAWDAGCRRVATWVVLRDKATGQQIAVYSIHLDHQGSIAREEGGKVVVAKMVELQKEYPDALLLVAGDYNEGPTKPGYLALKTLMDDARDVAEVTTDEGTFGNYGTVGAEPTGIIDYIMIYGADAEVSEFDILREGYPAAEGSDKIVNPSDHHGLLATFEPVSDIYVGGIAGGNEGIIRRAIGEGAAVAEKKAAMTVGIDKGVSEEVYSLQPVALLTEEEGEEPEEDPTVLKEVSLQTAYNINQQAGYGAFTVVDGAYAVVGSRGFALPAEYTVNDEAQYALAGSTVTLDTEGYTAPVCALDHIYFEGASFIVPAEGGAITVTEAVECTEHDYSIYVNMGDRGHRRVCSANAAHYIETYHAMQSLEDGTVVPGICDQQGYTVYDCLYCDYSTTGNKTAAPGHIWGKWEDVSSATATEQGQARRDCMDCDAFETKAIPCDLDPAVIATAVDNGDGYVELSVDLINNPGMAGVKIVLGYDPALLELDENSLQTGGALTGLSAFTYGVGTFSYAVANTDNFTEDGNAYKVRLKILGEGTTRLTLTVEDAVKNEFYEYWGTDKDGNPKLMTGSRQHAVTLYAKDAALYVHLEHHYAWDAGEKDYLCSCGEIADCKDVNMDGELTVLDATVLLQYLLEGSVVEIDAIAADYSRDGTISLTDVVILLRALNQ